MSDWHGYPQHPDSHPERPWWRRDGDLGFWKRTDGVVTRQAGPTWLADRDAAHPIPPPEPRCQQVWVTFTPAHEAGQDTVIERGVVGVTRKSGLAYIVRWGDGQADYLRRTIWSEDGESIAEHHVYPHAWPPPGAVLVAGPGSPWAPMGVERG